MIKRRTLSKVIGGQVQNTGGANAPPVKQLKNALRYLNVTHRQTDRQTDGRTIYDRNIPRFASRGKK